jgi:hypothetical protein
MAALLLAACCGPWWGSNPKRKRLILVLIVGLLSWGMENMIFAMATMKGVHATDATLSRPYLFFLTPIVARTWAFLVLCFAVGAAVWVTSEVSWVNTRTTKRDLEQGGLRQARNCPVHEPESVDNAMGQIRQIPWPSEGDSRSERMMLKSISLLTLITSPASLVSSFGTLGILKTKNPSSMYREQFILIPKSNGSFSNLDQILALVGGVIVLLTAIRRVYRSRLKRANTGCSW